VDRPESAVAVVLYIGLVEARVTVATRTAKGVVSGVLSVSPQPTTKQ